MCFEWCSVAVGRSESSALLLYCISSGSCLCCSSVSSELQHLHPSPCSHFPHSEQPQPAFLPAQEPLHPSWDPPWCGCWLRAEPSLLEVGAVALQRGHHPAHPPLPKQRGWEHRGCSSGWERGMSHPCGSPGGGRPTEPPMQAGIHLGEWQSRGLFSCSKRIMSSLDTN